MVVKRGFGRGGWKAPALSSGQRCAAAEVLKAGEACFLLTLCLLPQGDKGVKGERGERGDRGLRGDPVNKCC